MTPAVVLTYTQGHLNIVLKSLPSRRWTIVDTQFRKISFSLFNPFDQQHTISFTCAISLILAFFSNVAALMIKCTVPPPHFCIVEIDVWLCCSFYWNDVRKLHKNCFVSGILFFRSLPGPATRDNTMRTVRSLRRLSTEHNNKKRGGEKTTIEKKETVE